MFPEGIIVLTCSQNCGHVLRLDPKVAVVVLGDNFRKEFISGENITNKKVNEHMSTKT